MRDVKEVISEIKSKITVVEYARDILGFGIKKPGDRWYSLKPSSTNKTCCVFQKDYFKDFNLDISGDVVDLCAYTKYNGDKGKAIRDLASYCGISIEEDLNWKKNAQAFGDRCALWHNQLLVTDKQYLKERGITEETTKRLMIGRNEDRLIIPIWKNKQIVFYVGRGSDPKYKNCTLSNAPTGELTPYGFHTLNRETPLIITEGVFDGITADQAGYQTIASLGGSFNKNVNKQVVGACKSQEQDIILVFDKDENGAGQKFLLEMAKNLFSHSIKFYIYQFEQNEDLNDMYVRKGSIKEVEEKKEDGLAFLVKNIKEKDEFKKFARRASKFVGKAEIAEIFDLAAETTFIDSKSWLKEVKKQAMSCPTEDYITNEIVKKKDLLWREGLGFFEYSSGCWRMRNDKEIEGMVGTELGHYRTAAKLKAVRDVLRAEVETKNEFDKNNYLNFLNGMYNLDTGKIEQHSKELMSSIQIKYNYNSRAKCPRWTQFIEEISEGKEDKIRILQEIAGYTLFPNNSLQKAFILIGGGSNGKSVFLETLKDVFGEENCSAVEMSSLTEEFERILLKDSMLNISTEMSTTLKGAEATFKNIVAGEPINGCYKHQKHVMFSPRVKMIFATNSMIRSKDLTHGFTRRLLFVKFNLEFKTQAEGGAVHANQRVADVTLIPKLKDELDGIFNWVYEGYLRLKKNNSFTQSSEHLHLVEEMKKQMNPAYQFFNELEREEYQPAELYGEYKGWCSKNDRMSLYNDEFLFLADNAMNTEYRGNFKYFIKRA